MDKLISSLMLCRKAGKLVCGTDMCVDAMRERKALLVAYASDVSENTEKKIKDKAASYNINSEKLPYTCAELGNAFGKKPCAAVAVCDSGFVTMFMQAKNKQAEVN